MLTLPTKWIHKTFLLVLTLRSRSSCIFCVAFSTVASNFWSFWLVISLWARYYCWLKNSVTESLTFHHPVVCFHCLIVSTIYTTSTHTQLIKELAGTTLAIPILDNSQQFNFSTLQLQCTITIAIPQTSRTTIQLIHSTDLELDSVDKTEKQVYTTIFVLLWSNQHLYTSNYWKRVLTNRIQQENNRSKTLRQKSNMRWA